MKFEPIRYSDLNGKAQENYNFQKVSAILADYGFSTLRLSDDWQGADFIALKFDGSVFLKVQLKGRFEVAKRYEKKEIWVCFRFRGGLYLFPHDEILAKLKKEKPKMFITRSWLASDGKYNQNLPDKILKRLLEAHFYPPVHDKANPAAFPVNVDLSKLAPLQHKIAANHPRLDLEKWRDTPKDYVRLRD